MSGIMSRAEAGYHMLVILSSVDGKLNGKEDEIIRGYVAENYKEPVDFEMELKILQNIPAEDYPVHFNNAMNQFYMHSDKDERNHFLDLATKLVIADKTISPKENLFLNELYYAWEIETEE